MTTIKSEFDLRRTPLGQAIVTGMIIFPLPREYHYCTDSNVFYAGHLNQNNISFVFVFVVGVLRTVKCP